MSVGVSSVAGYVTSFAGFAGAVAAYLNGDHTQQTTGIAVSGAIGLISLIVTQVGRYSQAHAAVKAAPAVLAVPVADEPVQLAATEPPPLTDEQANDDPDMGDPLDATPESFVADRRDRRGATDLPVAA